MEKYYKKDDSKKSTHQPKESCAQAKRPLVELIMDDIVADPGLRKPIDDFHHDIRDDARRAFLEMGPFQPAS
jgi:hypothetical protein